MDHWKIFKSLTNYHDFVLGVVHENSAYYQCWAVIRFKNRPGSYQGGS